MTLETIYTLIPDYAKDLKINLKRILTEEGAEGLDFREISAVALASAMAAPDKRLVEALEEFATPYLSDKEKDGAKLAHAIMSMTNVYFRFLHVANNTAYKRMPPKLRKQSELNPGIDKKSFEMAALAVSAINDCKACIDYHELGLSRMGVSAVAIQSCIRIASVIRAVGEVLKFV